MSGMCTDVQYVPAGADGSPVMPKSNIDRRPSRVRAQKELNACAMRPGAFLRGIIDKTYLKNKSLYLTLTDDPIFFSEPDVAGIDRDRHREYDHERSAITRASLAADR